MSSYELSDAAKAGFGVGYDGRHPVVVVLPTHVSDLVGALQGLVDAPHQLRHAIHRVQALIRISFAGAVVVARHLPAAHVDGLEPGLHHLDRLVACDRAQRAYERVGVEQRPQPFGAHPRHGMLDHETAAQAQNLLRSVRSRDARPARGPGPILAHLCGKVLLVHRSAYLLIQTRTRLPNVGRTTGGGPFEEHGAWLPLSCKSQVAMRLQLCEMEMKG